MAIDVPYSYLLRDDDLAWSCGQLALDPDSNVVFPDDLARQSSVVCDHVAAILERADLPANGLRRLYLYHAAPDAGAEQAMVQTFRDRFGDHVQLASIPVPHFYYDGILLEVDLWWSDSDELQWTTASSIEPSTERLSEHLVLPRATLSTATGIPDPGAAIDGGPELAEPHLLAIELAGTAVSETVESADAVTTVLRQAGPYTWLQGRCTNGELGLVPQTEAIMDRFDVVLGDLRLGYNDVAKSTTHYVGGSSAAELHDNMAVRNRRYSKPGPASTGLPVYGFADPASKVVVDITLVRR
jgi:enamine deaminase RidA (YjgF/YER057c/UK114 family)